MSKIIEKEEIIFMNEVCISCGDKIKYECHTCGTYWCDKCAKQNDYECTECPPGDLIELKNKEEIKNETTN